MKPARVALRVLVLGLGALVPAAAAVACDDMSSPVVAAADARGDDAPSRQEDDAGAEAGPPSTCAITRAYFEGCGNEADLNCGSDGFDAWCAANDETINSAAYRRAEAACLTQDRCDGADRRDCEYRHYAEETPTEAEQALVAAYCEACDPSDVAGCAVRATTYDPAKGIKSVPDVFVAAWELADDLVDEIRTTCTGGAGDAGDAGAEACAKAFSACAADVYLDRLPDCAE